MLGDITRRQTPEERELAKKRLELAACESQLADRELELVTLQTELHTLETHYLHTVGLRYAELDEIEAQIAELQVGLHPREEQAQQRATQARAQAGETAHVARLSSEKGPFNPSDSLKQLYRQLAKLFHPDLTTNPVEEQRRHRFMAAVNIAYRAGDEVQLQRILREWENDAGAVSGDSIGSDLIRVIRQIAQGEERLEVIAREIEALLASDPNQLREQVDAAKLAGRDLLAELAEQIDEDIAAARSRHGELSRRGYADE